jgi:hypothetical protein
MALPCGEAHVSKHRAPSLDGQHFLWYAIGAAEHAAKHLVEHYERGVCEDRFHLAEATTRVANRRVYRTVKDAGRQNGRL